VRGTIIITKLREPANGLTHLAGVCLSVVALGVLLWLGIRAGDPRAVIGFTIFGLSQIALFTASTLYHSLRLSPGKIAHLRRIDHMMVFVLIAGTYTPICLVALHGGWRWGLLGTIWGLAAAGLIIKTRWMHAPRWFSTVLYLLMGWVAIVAAPVLFQVLPGGAIGWLLAGGIVYSIGAVIYALKRPNLIRWFDHHALWHLFVLAGSACFFWVIVAYVA
jgi:hemolysin III